MMSTAAAGGTTGTTTRSSARLESRVARYGEKGALAAWGRRPYRSRPNASASRTGILAQAAKHRLSWARCEAGEQPLIDVRYRCENGGRSHDAVAFASREGQEYRCRIAACFG
jgi:hypothetical protein